MGSHVEHAKDAMNQTNVDDVDVDTSNSMELSNRWIQALEAWECRQWWIMTKKFEIVQFGVEEGVDWGSGMKQILLPNVVLQGDL